MVSFLSLSKSDWPSKEKKPIIQGYFFMMDYVLQVLNGNLPSKIPSYFTLIELKMRTVS